jgi:molybdopterin synthase sulfur carrier subunit
MVRVRLFAALRERVGWAERTLPMPSHGFPETPSGLWRQLALGDGSDAEAEGLPAGLRVAVNHAFAAPDTPLKPGDEVAFLPPITGG